MNQRILESSAKHARPREVVYQYGTAGFRMKADLLDSVVYRVGLLAALRSRKSGGQAIGVMITASHNPPEDNGVKLVDPMGEMLDSLWEPHATELANAETDEKLVEVYERLADGLKIDQTARAKVIFARDTRASGPRLVGCLVDALKATGSEYTDYDYLTTPQLHYLVRCVNTNGTVHIYGEASEQGYYQKLSDALDKALKYRKTSADEPEDKGVIVDCANGIGGPKLRAFLNHLSGCGQKRIKIQIVNDDVHTPESLNSQCGADFVKTNQRAPPTARAGPLERCASLDGDADRVVYYFHDKDSRFNLLDGDRIATLAALFIRDLARLAGLEQQLNIGVVQTAYANGASTKYITSSLGLPVVCTPTGVKHLHHAALRFDVGVYFEANGHGTVVFSPAALTIMAKHKPQSPAHDNALQTLRALKDLINQTVGDALSDLLLVEVILAHKKWGLAEWLNTYNDLPNRLVRVEVKNRNIFRTTDAERRLETPQGIQEEIDKLVGKYKQGRSFARASGTEDAVRVYAEAETRTEADDLAQKVALLVKQFDTP